MGYLEDASDTLKALKKVDVLRAATSAKKVLFLPRLYLTTGQTVPVYEVYNEREFGGHKWAKVNVSGQDGWVEINNDVVLIGSPPVTDLPPEVVAPKYVEPPVYSPTPSATGAGSPATIKSTKSKTGVIIGVVAGIAAIGTGLYFLIARRRK